MTSAQCAREMAEGVARLLGADAAVAVTGVGGPEPLTASRRAPCSRRSPCAARHVTQRFQFDGDPAQVVHQTVGAALAMLRDALPHPGGPEPRPGSSSIC